MNNRQINIWKALLLEQYVQDIIDRQVEAGWQFNVEKAKQFIIYLEKERERLYNLIRPHLTYTVSCPYNVFISQPFKKDGNYSSNAINWMGDSIHLVGGPFTRVEFTEPNLDSDKQLKDQLFKLGWTPDEWNYKKDKKKRIIYENGEPIKTSPKLTESSYDSLTVGIGPDLALYLKVSMRLSSIKGWLNNVREDGTIEARGNPLATPTGRTRHNLIVNLPKAKDSVFFGKECRSLFIARAGRELTGYDASQLEARMEAHWVFNINRDYALEIIHGDLHQANADKWEITRDEAKTTKYSLTFGAYPPKLAKTNKWPLKKAQKVFDAFWSDDNPINTLFKRTRRFWKRTGYVMGLDGRPIYVRKEADIVNYLFQSSAQIIHKTGMVLMDDWRKKYNLDIIQVSQFHDEVCFDSSKNDSKLCGQLGVSSLKKAGEIWQLKVELTGDWKVGQSYDLIH